MTNVEIWKTCVENANYEVSGFGRVRNASTGRILKQNISSSGYPFVHLGRKRKNMKVHILVASAFIGEKMPGFDVDHIDHDRTNANLNNLRYLSIKENRGKAGRMKRKPILQIENGIVVKRFESATAAAKEMKCVPSAIMAAANGKVKTSCGYCWRYV